MNKSNEPLNVPDLIALVNEIVTYWKAIAQRNFKKAYPNADQEEFQRVWPKALDNFFLAETVRTAKLVRSLPSEGCNN